MIADDCTVSQRIKAVTPCLKCNQLLPSVFTEFCNGVDLILPEGGRHRCGAPVADISTGSCPGPHGGARRGGEVQRNQAPGLRHRGRPGVGGFVWKQIRADDGG